MDLAGTRAAYDAVAVEYGRQIVGLDPESSLDRAMLAEFATRVQGAGRVLDAGCGTGRMTAYLASLGVEVDGLDLSPGMLDVARSAYPSLVFTIGSMAALDVPDASLAGVLAWYSLIHTAPADLPAVVSELARALAPGGHLLVGFQAGLDEVREIRHAYGHDVVATAYRHDPASVAVAMHEAGLVVDTRLVREPRAGLETSRQASLLAVRPDG